MDSKDMMDMLTEKGRLAILMKKDAETKRYLATIGKAVKDGLDKLAVLEQSTPRLYEQSNIKISSIETKLNETSKKIESNVRELLRGGDKTQKEVDSLTRKTENLVNSFAKSTKEMSTEIAAMKKIVDTYALISLKEREDGKDGKGIERAYLDAGKLILVYTDGTQDNLGKITPPNSDMVGQIRKGGRGEPGTGIASITLTSGDHSPGTLDTYTIAYTDASVPSITYQVYNGADGLAVVRDNLTTDSSTDALSAKQGKVLSELVSTNKTEVSDIRIATDGVASLSAGAAIREIQSAFNLNRSKNMFDKTAILTGIRISTVGVEVVDANYVSSDYISVIAGNTIYFSKLNGTLQVLSAGCFYDINKVFISFASASSYVVPANAVYFRLSTGLATFNANSSTLQLEYDSVTSFSSYVSPYYSIPFKTSTIGKKRRIIRCIAHQGYNLVAPNQTIPAYIEASNSGFDYGECDIKLTSDGVPVCCHNTTVYADVANMRVNPIITSASSPYTTAIVIASTTLATLQTYDWGYWKSSVYAGTKIPTFDDIVKTCKLYGIGLYVDNTYNLNDSQYTTLISTINKYGMLNKILWTNPVFSIVAVKNPTAVMAVVNSSYLFDHVTYAIGLKASYPNATILLSYSYTGISEANIATIRSNGLGVELWTIDDKPNYLLFAPLVDGITSNLYTIDDVLY